MTLISNLSYNDIYVYYYSEIEGNVGEKLILQSWNPVCLINFMHDVFGIK